MGGELNAFTAKEHTCFYAHVLDEDTPLAVDLVTDVVLRGVEVLAEEVGDVVVVDVGGATTDVHAVVEVDPEQSGLAREVVATTRAGRTVEGDLGMRWSAISTRRQACPRCVRRMPQP